MNTPLSKRVRQCLAFLLFLDFLGTSGVLAQSGDGGGAQGVEPGGIGAGPGTSTAAGSAGPDTGSVNLSKGATIAIAVVVSLVVVLGSRFLSNTICLARSMVLTSLCSAVTMAVLFFMAKRRQWTMKETLRRSARKVSSAVRAVTTPLTPKKMTFSPINAKQRNEALLKKANDEITRSRADARKSEKQRPQGSRSQPSSGSDRDLEKGIPASAIKAEAKSEMGSTAEEKPAEKDRKRPRPPSLSIPSSAFEMDSPKTPMWKKVFGR